MNRAIGHKLRPNWLGVALALVLALPGCSGVRSGSSFTGPLPSSAAIGISWDASERMSALYPPGHTALYLTTLARISSRPGQRFLANSLKTISAPKGSGLYPLQADRCPR